MANTKQKPADRFDMRVEISRGKFKRLGDCTSEDLEAAAKLLEARASEAQREAVRFEKMAERLHRKKVQR